jgi:hypothetical protein
VAEIQNMSDFSFKFSDVIGNSLNASATDTKDKLDLQPRELRNFILGLVNILNSIDGADSLSAKGFDNLKTTIQAMLNDLNIRKLDQGSNFTGTWHGFKPSQAEPGLSALVDSHTEQLNDIVPLKDTDQVLLVSAFSGLSGGLDLYYSKDAKKLIPINGSNSIIKPALGTLRDPSMLYKNGVFYVAYTNQQPSGVGFTIAKSTDLKTWTEYYISVPAQYTKCWAPEWFQDDDGSVYILLSLQTNNAVENDNTNTSIPYFKQYYMKLSNIDTLTFNAPVEMIYSQVSNKIDSFIYKENGVYNCFVKNEYSKTIEHYNKNTLETGTWTYQRTITFPVPVEGASIVKFNNKYYLYVDGFDTNTSWCSESTDLITWGTAYIVNSLSNIRIQHFSVMLTNVEINKKLNLLISKNNSVVSSDIKNDIFSSKKYFSLSKFMSGNTLKLANYQNAVYRILTGENITIDNIDVAGYNYDGEISICFAVLAPNGSSSSITLKNGNNILTPGNADFVISPTNANNETLIKFVCKGVSDAKFRLENQQNIGRYILNNKQQIKTDLYQPSKVDLNTLATAGVISSLVVSDDTYYYVSGTNSVTINAIDNTNVVNKTANIYFCVESGDVNAKIIIKSGGLLVTPNSTDLNIGKAYSNNDTIINFRKMFTWSNGWRKIG